MTKITSKFVEIEMFYTSDGEEFIDDGAATEHQMLIDQKQAMMDTMNMDETELSDFITTYEEFIKREINNG